MAYCDSCGNFDDQDRTLDESNQAVEDREILPDDDGDYNDEHEGY